jgi:hypothetical protein
MRTWEENKTYKISTHVSSSSNIAYTSLHDSLSAFSLPTPIPFYIEKLKEEIDEEISRTNDKSNARKSHVSCSFETPNGSLVSLLALLLGSSIYTSASH